MVKYTDKAKGAGFKLVYEKTQMYSADAMFRTDIKTNRYLIRPRIDIKSPKKQLALLDGTFDFKVGKAVKVDFTLSKVFKDDTKLKGTHYTLKS